MSVNPASSRAVRATRTWPSIIPLGPTTWAPARACDTAIDAYRSRVASLSTRPRSSRTPQWPWSVNSSRQRSAMMTRSSPTASRTRATATLRMPSGSSAPEPTASLVVGTPKIMNPPTPAATQARASSTSESRVCWTTPGMLEIGTGAVAPSLTKTGSTKSRGCSRVSATSARTAAFCRSRRGRVTGSSTPIGGSSVCVSAPGDGRSTSSRSAGGPAHRPPARRRRARGRVPRGRRPARPRTPRGP